MELWCLNCQTCFNHPEEPPHNKVVSIKCPNCGIESHFTKKPQHLFSIQETKKVLAPPRPPTTSKFMRPTPQYGIKVGQTQTQQPSTDSSFRKADVYPEYKTRPKQEDSKSILQPQISDSSYEDGPFFVKSPTGLVLEFPSSKVVQTWASIIENTVPYQISQDTKEWISLDVFLSGYRVSAVEDDRLRKAVAKISESKATIVPIDADGKAEEKTSTEKPRETTDQQQRKVEIQRGIRDSPTSQFTFKIKETPSPKSVLRKWVVAGIIIVIMVGGTLGLYFAGVFKL